MNSNKIIQLYTKGNKNISEIATEMNTYPNKIRRILIKENIQLDSKSEAQKKSYINGTTKIPTAGKKRTKEEKLKISKGLQKTWANISEEEYKQRVDGAKKRWNKMSEKDKQEMHTSAIKAIQKAGKEGSKLEKFIKYELTKAGHEIEIHKKNLLPNENLEIDMYFPKLKAIIEIDGPSHFLPIWGAEKLQKQIKSDEVKTGLILSRGFIIIRVKNLHNSISLHNQEKLKNNLITKLNEIEQKQYSDVNRYIEIEA
jgi:very-short-patch-repair endonuclease